MDISTHQNSGPKHIRCRVHCRKQRILTR